MYPQSMFIAKNKKKKNMENYHFFTYEILLIFSRWLDKLGLAARLGVDVVVRQSFYGGHYALLETHSRNPRPVRL